MVIEINLPNYSTPFVGRAEEMTELTHLLDNPDCRLVTLVGPGGIGKTRLAIEVATILTHKFSDGTSFVTLQAIRDADHIVPKIANDIAFKFAHNKHLDRQLHDHLYNKQMLLILDSFEHLLERIDIIVELLATSSQLKLLITSREALKLREEWLFHVEGLSYPPHQLSDSSKNYNAVKLFAKHAHRARHDFSLEDEYAHVVHICQLVQGIPLGIELAATWCRSLPCVEIARELQRDIDILKTDLHNIPDSHRSMRGVFDKSWSLLNNQERTMLK